MIVAGASRGGEAALLIGATYPKLVGAVVGACPNSDVVGAYPGPGAAWTLNGKPVPEGPIPIWQIIGPVFVTGGGHDAIWPSAGFVREILQEAKAHGKTNVIGRIFRDGQHPVGFLLPYFPPVWAGGIAFSTMDESRANARGWQATLAFLESH